MRIDIEKYVLDIQHPTWGFLSDTAEYLFVGPCLLLYYRNRPDIGFRIYSEIGLSNVSTIRYPMSEIFPVPTVFLKLSYPENSVFVVLFLSNLSFMAACLGPVVLSVLVVMLYNSWWLSCPSSPVLYWLSCSGSEMSCLFVTFSQSCSSRPVVAVLLWLSCSGFFRYSGCPVFGGPHMAVLFWLSFLGWPDLSALISSRNFVLQIYLNPTAFRRIQHAKISQNKNTFSFPCLLHVIILYCENV